jgi:hypothetical protein
VDTRIRGVVQNRKNEDDCKNGSKTCDQFMLNLEIAILQHGTTSQNKNRVSQAI